MVKTDQTKKIKSQKCFGGNVFLNITNNFFFLIHMAVTILFYVYPAGILRKKLGHTAGTWLINGSDSISGLFAGNICLRGQKIFQSQIWSEADDMKAWLFFLVLSWHSVVNTLKMKHISSSENPAKFILLTSLFLLFSHFHTLCQIRVHKHTHAYFTTPWSKHTTLISPQTLSYKTNAFARQGRQDRISQRPTREIKI